MGVDHVGFGPDYIDYIMDDVLEWMKRSSLPNDALPYAIGACDITGMPKFVEGMAARGYNDEEIRKVMGQNFLRVYRDGL